MPKLVALPPFKYMFNIVRFIVEIRFVIIKYLYDV